MSDLKLSTNSASKRFLVAQVMVAIVSMTGLPGVSSESRTSTVGIPQDGIPQDGIPRDGIPRDGIPRDGIPQDEIAQDGIPRDGIPRDGIPQDEIPQDEIAQDGIAQIYIAQVDLNAHAETEEEKAQRKKEKDLLELSKTKKSTKAGNAPCLTWLPSNGSVKAVLLCVHGLGLHNGTYADFGQRMATLGYATYAIDVRGFGSFMEAKGREQVDFDGCLKDVESTLKVLHHAHKNVPIYLLGESMGGAIALRATAIYPNLVDGLISSVPANDRFKQAHTSLNVAVHLLEDPSRPFDVGKEIISQATDKQDLREHWSKDPLNKLNLSPKELLQFQHFMNQNHKCAKLVERTPVLFIQGCKDKLVKPKGTVELFQELATKDKRLDLIANGEHLYFEENQFTDDGINMVDQWIDNHLPVAKSPE